MPATDDTVRVKDAYCSYCGNAFVHPEPDWPRRCAHCGGTTYRNPLPVAVALLPVRRGTDPLGLAVVRRTIEPGRGQLALPGGFIDHGETWQEALVRELGEETGIPADVNEVRLADTLSSRAGHLLVFGLLEERNITRLPLSVPTDETEGWEFLPAPIELAFPLHTRAARCWFDGLYV
ncbi:NUDIX domain-containing protein [Wenjunlia tyrosinilytica]|uniref:NUDIX domain-containing protein n=1 Tax=Wenjunlia tyrosinilytica TaxID=1544741 RepID=UPI00166A3CE1|nr:NUDIX domain-containing protein [Wenjunlia tyrosinilytica]